MNRGGNQASFSDVLNEVLYLHSLLRRKPPTAKSKSGRIRSIPQVNRVSNSKSLKRSRGSRSEGNNHVTKIDSVGSEFHLRRDLGPEWPVGPGPSSSPPTTSGWPDGKTDPRKLYLPRSDLNDRNVSDLIMHQNVQDAFNNFLNSRKHDDDNDDEDDDGDEEDDDDEVNAEDSREYRFLLSLFEGNAALRDFYVKNQDHGDFFCLICGGMGKRKRKVFQGCVGLVHHATAISKTKRKRVHRAFGRVICRVIGWDFSRLPMIVFKGAPLAPSGVELSHNATQVEKPSLEIK